MSPKLPVLNSRQLIRALKKGGFAIDRQEGSHISLIHPDHPELTVTVPYHNRDLKKGTLHHILEQAGMTVQQLWDLL
jgi:predicted RNA binding protein YcfA (HicA-like mRNA interferase family)